MSKKKFPEGVLLGEMPKDRPLGWMTLAWGGNNYIVKGQTDRGVTRHFASDSPHPILSFASAPGFGVYMVTHDGERWFDKYIGSANTVFELQDLLGIPRVKSTVEAA